MAKKVKIENDIVARELSWLSFNERVLQEAEDESVPLIERMRFMGIFSNNRDEFFRVRVATLKRMQALGKKQSQILDYDVDETLEKIQSTVLSQQQRFDKLYNTLINKLEKEGVFIVNEKQLNESQGLFVRNYFTEKVRPNLVPIMLSGKSHFPFLKDKATYLSVKFYNSGGAAKFPYALIEVPRTSIGRFLVLPQEGTKKYVILIDDVIRYCLADLFPIFNFDKLEAYAIKLTRDAELDIEDDVESSYMDKLQKSLRDRKRGQPVRFVYDVAMPADLLSYILDKLKSKKHDNLIPGGRYHNFKDFINFPEMGEKKLLFEKLPPLRHPDFIGQKSLLSVIKKKDVMLFFPYQTFDHVIDLLREAAIDPAVTSIKINLYRVAAQSKIINTLINAARNGKEVVVLVELQARFDEEANIHWAKKLQEEKVKVIFGIAGLKVHSKLILISRGLGKKQTYFAHIGTGNFNESTAKIYTDISLLTADRRISMEVERVFDFLENTYKSKRYNHLLVSPVNTRRHLSDLISEEIKHAKKGRPSGITLKLNNLVDTELIRKLYEASQSGVSVRLMVRGMTSIAPGVKGLSENIQAFTIVDRFLEHARVFIFQNGGDPLYFVSSADWMRRNLDKRVEITTPVLDARLKKMLQEYIEIQFSDNTKCRILDHKQRNKYKVASAGEKKVNAQHTLYKYFSNLATAQG